MPRNGLTGFIQLIRRALWSSPLIQMALWLLFYIEEESYIMEIGNVIKENANFIWIASHMKYYAYSTQMQVWEY